MNKYEFEVTDETRAKVEAVLIRLGVDPSCMGYYYLIEIVSMYLSGYTVNHNITCLYNLVGEHFEKTGTRVERAIRHVITKGFNYIVSQGIDFGFTEDGQLPNRQFIFTLVRHIKICDTLGKDYFDEKR